MDMATDPVNGTKVVHRASLLRELLAPLPTERLHASKALTAISATDAGDVQVTFRDGGEETFQAVIGADGIFGAVRQHVLQDTVDADAPSAAGFWDCRNVVPFEKARKTLGAEFFEVDRQYGWAGNGAFIMHDVLDNGANVQCVISAIENDAPKDRKRPLTREFLEQTLREWLSGPIGKGMIDVSQALYPRSQPTCLGLILEAAADGFAATHSSSSTNPSHKRTLSGNTNSPRPSQMVGSASPATQPTPPPHGREPAPARLLRMR